MFWTKLKPTRFACISVQSIIKYRVFITDAGPVLVIIIEFVFGFVPYLLVLSSQLKFI